MLNKSVTKRTDMAQFYSHEVLSRLVIFTQRKSRIVVARCWGKEGWGLLLNRLRISVLQNEKKFCG